VIGDFHDTLIEHAVGTELSLHRSVTAMAAFLVLAEVDARFTGSRWNRF
jgi:hypothetical protein